MAYFKQFLNLCILSSIFAVFSHAADPLTAVKNFQPDCFNMLRVFAVKMSRPLLNGEMVGLSGDHPQLGAWNVDQSLAMQPTDKEMDFIWRLTMPLCSRDRIYYRYFIYVTDASGNKEVRNWEGSPQPRYLEPSQIYKKSGVERYGEYGSERGWLRYSSVVELQFIWEKQLTYATANNLTGQESFWLQLFPFEKSGKQLKALPDGEVLVEVSSAGYNHSQFGQTASSGIPYNPGDVVLFQITASSKKSYMYLLQLTGDEVTARVLIPSTGFKGSEGILELALQPPYQDNSITLPYLVVRPLPFAPLYTLSESFHHYWPNNWPIIDVGGRGAGRSYYDGEAPYVENTMTSFLVAQAEKADMVKVDVVITRDYVPVLWHDFGFYTAPKNVEVTNESQLRYQLIKDISYAQLKKSRVFVKTKQHLVEYTHLNVLDENQKDCIFLRLIAAFLNLPNELGIIVELKWPQPLEKGAIESSSRSLDKNYFVDAVLNNTLWHSCNRPLIFASLDADTCTLLRFKQNVYPVMFFTFGESNLWKQYKDLRTRTFLDAVNFAQAQDLLGIAPRSEPFLAALIELATKLKQVVFIWGDNMRNGNGADLYKRLKATGVIYDQLHLHGTQDKRGSLFSARLLDNIFSMRCENLQVIIDAMLNTGRS